MKWNNPGHEFDKIGERICDDGEQYYIWGTANAGNLFINKFRDEIKIVGCIDSDLQKQGLSWNGFIIQSPEVLDSSQPFKVIITSSKQQEIAKALEQRGLKKNESYFHHAYFSSIFNMYKHERLVLERTDISLTEKCNLRCANCNMFMPYYKNPRHYPLDSVKADMDAYFACVNHVTEFNLLGGELFLYPWLSEIVTYIGDNYRRQIDNLVFFTNGTILPTEQVLELMRKFSINVQLTDYSEMVPYGEKIEKFQRLLEEWNIPFTYYSLSNWLDFGLPDEVEQACTEEELSFFFDCCGAPFRGLYQGKLYFCHLNTSAIRGGLYSESVNDSIVLDRSDAYKKMELLEFDLGYNDLGYVTFCRHCKGCDTVNQCYVKGGLQQHVTPHATEGCEYAKG